MGASIGVRKHVPLKTLKSGASEHPLQDMLYVAFYVYRHYFYYIICTNQYQLGGNNCPHISLEMNEIVAVSPFSHRYTNYIYLNL